VEADRPAVQTWFFEQLAQRLAEVFEAMSGARPQISSAPPATPVAAPVAGGLRWRQAFNGVPGAAWIQASDQDWTEASNHILRAAGIESSDQETLKSTWTEALGQALSAIAQDFSGGAGREVTCATGQESAEPGPAQWIRLSIQFAGGSTPAVEVASAIEDALLDSLLPQLAHKAAAGTDSTPPASAAPAPSGPGASGSGGALTSKTFDLLLDVELPVSVSFGRAQVALKDVIKLTTGAIVELNRSISEPVEVIVNNCVIARGEVVVVEGNFGVRIREVISRQDRLRTLN
jgi:flagellar motor switch protein FliN